MNLLIAKEYVRVWNDYILQYLEDFVHKKVSFDAGSSAQIIFGGSVLSSVDSSLNLCVCLSVLSNLCVCLSVCFVSSSLPTSSGFGGYR